MNLWVDVAVMATLFALGNILFGHFEERTPKWRRVLKFFLFTGLIALISSTAGRWARPHRCISRISRSTSRCRPTAARR